MKSVKSERMTKWPIIGNEGTGTAMTAGTEFDGHRIRFECPAVVTVICPQVIESMSAFMQLRQYCSLLLLENGRVRIEKLSDFESQTIDRYLSELLLECAPGNSETILLLLMERRFRTFKMTGVEFAEKNGVEAEISIG